MSRASRERDGQAGRIVGSLALPLGVGLAFAVAIASLLVSVPSAMAFIPKANRTVKAIAAVNRSSGRNQALQFELTMRVGNREPVARGQLISHPSGLARLELRGFSGRVDRYLLSGSELSGAKDGFRLDRPQPILQPLFFMQPSSATTLRAALDAFDVRSESIGLAPCGEEDCFVIGDPRLAAPLPRRGLAGLELDGTDILADPLAGDSGDVYELAAALEGPELSLSEDARLPRLWVDTEDLQLRRIDRANGVFTIFGPIVSFDKLLVPSWFEIHEPGAEPIRFDVDRAVKVNAPPQAFSRKWLMTPVDPPPGVTPGPRGSAGDAPGPGAPATSDRFPPR